MICSIVKCLQRAFTVDERIAWAHISIPPVVFNDETIDDWYHLSGQLGEGKEGMINLIMSFVPVQVAPTTFVQQTGNGSIESINHLLFRCTNCNGTKWTVI
jgi:hypothetical protein